MPNLHPVEPEELMAYMDGELPAERASKAAGHLATCGECQRMAAEFRDLSRQLTAWEVEESGVTVAMPAVVVVRNRRARWVWWTGSGVGLAAACMVLLLFITPKRGQDVSGGQFGVDMARTPAVAFHTLLITPQIVRTADIALTTNQFEKARAALDEITGRYGGYVGQLARTTPPAAGRTLNATLRIPSAQLDQALAELRGLGHVDSESQGGQDVSAQVVDLDARIANAQTTEQRLRELLRQSTGKITDVLEVEKELSRVREQIERMQAERKSLGDRVSFTQLDVRINEEHKAQSTGGLRNAAIEGWRNLAGGVSAIAEFLLAYGPSLLLCGAIVFFPVRYLWKRRARTP